MSSLSSSCELLQVVFQKNVESTFILGGFWSHIPNVFVLFLLLMQSSNVVNRIFLLCFWFPAFDCCKLVIVWNPPVGFWSLWALPTKLQRKSGTLISGSRTVLFSVGAFSCVLVAPLHCSQCHETFFGVWFRRSVNTLHGVVTQIVSCLLVVGSVCSHRWCLMKQLGYECLGELVVLMLPV